MGLPLYLFYFVINAFFLSVVSYLKYLVSFMAANTWIVVFKVMTLCCLVGGYQHFGGMCRFRLEIEIKAAFLKYYLPMILNYFILLKPNFKYMCYLIIKCEVPMFCYLDVKGGRC